MEKIPDWNKKITPSIDKTKKDGLTRRGFLKILGLGGAALVGAEATKTAKYVYDSINMEDKGRVWRDGEEIDTKERVNQGIDSEEMEQWTELKEYIPGEDKNCAKNILGEYNLRPISLEGTKNATETQWYLKYKNTVEMRNSFEFAYKEIRPYINELKKIFRDEFAQLISAGKISEREAEDLAYLAIPESHMKWDISKKGARGAYQIIDQTARDEGMEINGRTDDRDDLIKCARAAARILRKNFQKTGNLDLAISWYDGGYVGRYVRSVYDKNKGKTGDDKEKMTYEGYLKFMEGRINGMKDWLKKKNWYHQVGKKETPQKIADYYGLPFETIARHNKLKKHYHSKKDKAGYYILRPGQGLWIPINDPKTKERIYDNFIDGFIENLNYPGKYNAVMNLIREKERMIEVRNKLAAKK